MAGLNSDSEEIIQLSHHEFLKIDKDYEEAATVANLIYVTDESTGIKRIKKGKGFTYIFDDKPLKDKEQIERIRKLAIPPAWINVWICHLPNGHIQATGFDLRQRKQYKYHNLWHTVRNHTKFHKLYEFGKALPQLRLRVEKDLEHATVNEQKVLATVISLMERTYIRIGNDGYEKLYGSYGLTTLKDKHVAINGSEMTFSFKGKKGVVQEISLKSKKLAKIVKACREIPGKELFQYFDEEGKRCTIDSGMVNNYIKETTGKDFSAKDFRTWAGSLNALRAFHSLGKAISESDAKKKVVQALDEVSKQLGNTRTVCKKYYVHPGIIQMYEEDKLNRYLDELDKIEAPDNHADLTPEEKLLMKVLKALTK